MQFSEISKLSFFTTIGCNYQNEHECDFKTKPRLHFYIVLLLEGTVVFNLTSGKVVSAKPGEIIFVPIMSRYISHYKGNPDISFISMQFSFEPFCGISEQDNYCLQKIVPDNFEELKDKFKYVLNNFHSDDISKQLSAVSVFYSFLSDLLPKLEKQEKQPVDKRIEKALEYINMYSEKPIKVSELANMCNMSTSSFYACFKKHTSLSPIEYKNQVVIKHAIHLLNEKDLFSIEEISDMLGFESLSYFYRLFKRLTGKTPVEYRTDYEKNGIPQ